MTLLRIEPALHAPAMMYEGERLTFADFWENVWDSVDRLRQGDRASQRFRFVFESDPGLRIFDLIATLKLGAAACPIDLAWPDRRFVSAIRLMGAQLDPGRPKRTKKTLTARVSVEPEDPTFDSALDLQRDEPAFAIFTSGSSGEPKAAVLSADNVCSAARYANRALNLAGRDRWLLSLPLHHVSGISVVFRCLLASATIAIPDPDQKIEDALEAIRPTHISLVATQLYRLLRDDRAADALARCKAVVMGGGPTPEPLVHEAVARGIPLVMSYGMTETAAMICCTRPGDPIERLLSSGKPLVEGTMSISADGEILVRGDQLFLGYLQPDGSMHRPLTEDGWFRTGDLGHFDAAGYLHVTGRRDNMFISGGENIQPEEIEQALRAIDGVEDAIVVGVEDAEWGKRPVAFVRMADGRAFEPEALQTALRKTLPSYKVPRSIHPWPDDLVPPGLKPARRDFEVRAKGLATDSTD